VRAGGANAFEPDSTTLGPLHITDILDHEDMGMMGTLEPCRCKRRHGKI
jgi:hypothetical protein